MPNQHRFKEMQDELEYKKVRRPLRPTRVNLEIPSTRPLEFGRFRTSRIVFSVNLPIRRGILWV